ncbi:Sporulation-specific protein SPO7 [Escovopsis weberi]|uniref:Sporulation-specific protein SPO7 n=1 Tax=Escovopsis weberi TaxID=150374 RepID=A0A0M8N1Z4_ESCWE|nr:Sporulation-specific protein SPO7 [Escovopsis weberi]
MPDDIDSLVKGASVSPYNVKLGTTSILSGAGKAANPLNHTPSSPSMIYLNLLILEASLRAQFLELRARRRHHTFFLALLTLWVAFFGYKLFFATREDGRGVGGSIYWAVEGAQKVCFMGGIITAVLVWATGIWDRGIRWPRRWFAISNRGLRSFNCKLVVIRQTWWAEALSTVAFFLTYGLFSHTASSSYRHVDSSLLRQVERELHLSSDNHPTLVVPSTDDDERGGSGGHEEDLAPGGDYVKLLLLPKPFSPTFRENWELYRTEYWERENERRALLRRKVTDHDRKLAKDLYGWLWWLPWRHAPHAAPRRRHDPHKAPHHRLASVERERRRRNSSVRRSSFGSSRSPTPMLDQDAFGRKAPAAGGAGGSVGGAGGSGSGSGSGTSEKLRKKPSSYKKRGGGGGTESRSSTPTPAPDVPSKLSMESSSPAPDTESEGSTRVLRSAGEKASKKEPSSSAE